MKIGDKLRGVITGIKPYGAFVSLENGTTGLIHISEIKTGYIRQHLQYPQGRPGGLGSSC